MKFVKVSAGIGVLILIAVLVQRPFFLDTGPSEKLHVKTKREFKITPELKEILEVEKSLLVENDPSGFVLKRTGYEIEVIAPNGVKNIFKGMSPENQMGQIDSDGKVANWHGDHFLIEKGLNPKGLLFYVEYYEGSGYAFIDENGNNVPIKHYPFFSPSGNKIAVVNFSEAFDFDGWQILEKINGKFSETGVLVDKKWKDRSFYSLEFDKWSLDEAKVHLQVGFQESKGAELGNEMIYYNGTLEKIDGNWILLVDDTTPTTYRKLPNIENKFSRQLFF